MHKRYKKCINHITISFKNSINLNIIKKMLIKKIVINLHINIVLRTNYYTEKKKKHFCYNVVIISDFKINKFGICFWKIKTLV